MAITLTQSASKRVRSFLERDGGVGLRLGVRKTGCSGYAYVVEIADRIGEDDLVFEHDDIKVVVSSESIGFINGSEVDFVTEGLNREFKFKNPNAADECGCGESFTINPA